MTRKELNPSTYDVEDWLREDESAMIRRGEVADRMAAMTVDGIIRGLVEDGLADEIRYILDQRAPRDDA